MDVSLNNPQTVEVYKKQSQFKEICRRFVKSKGALIGLILFAAVAILLLCADLIVPYDMATMQDVALKNAPPSSEHWFGCDAYEMCIRDRHCRRPFFFSRCRLCHAG